MKFHPPERAFQAYLYDCDGTLADTMAAHVETWIEELARYGCVVEKELFYELAGMPGRKTVLEINRRFQLSLPPDEIAEQKEELFYQRYLHRITPILPVVEHLKKVSAFAKIGVVSGGKTKVVQETLRLIGVDHLVQALVCAEDVKEGKPSPEPFLLAAQKLGIAPGECLVIEDADFGVRSAIAAGMSYVKIEL